MVLYIIVLLLEIGAGYTIYIKSTDLIITLFIFGLMLVGLVCLYAALQEDRKNKDALMYLYQGYETILLYTSYLLLMIGALGIILGFIDAFTIASPFVMVMWLVPMVTMLVYQGAIVFTNSELKISNKEIDYRSIRQLQIEVIKNKKKITFFTKDGNYTYKAKSAMIEQIESFLINKNRNIKIKSL